MKTLDGKCINKPNDIKIQKFLLMNMIWFFILKKSSANLDKL